MEKILFLDDHHVSHASGMDYAWHAPERNAAGPVIYKTQDWEMLFSAYGSMLVHEGKYHMYYTMWQLDDKPPYGRLKTGICYAESGDGIHWQKPELGIVKEINGGKNNLLHWGGIFDQPNVLYTAGVTPGHTYSLLYYGKVNEEGWGVRLCHSNDGLHWNWPGKMVWQTPCDKKTDEIDYYAGDDAISVCYDASKKTFLLYRKVMQDFDLVYDAAKHAGWLPDKSTLCRMIAVAESGDLVTWKSHRIMMKPDPAKEPAIDYHKFSCSPLAGGGYLGMLEVHDSSPGKRQIALDLLYSRTGEQWRRGTLYSTPFLRNESPADWDYGMKFTNSSFLHETGGELRFYYGAIKAALEHDQALVNCSSYGVGLCTVPVDGIRSIGCGEAEGEMVTGELWAGSGIFVKADVEEGGIVEATLLDANNEPLPYHVKPLLQGGSRCKLQVVPAPGADIGKCRLRFRLKKARLYAIYTGHD